MYLDNVIKIFANLFMLSPMYNVLIADDDVDAWFQVNALLRRHFLKASFVTNLNAAKQYIEQHIPSLLFFDRQLQNHSTLDFIKYVRSKYPEAKIIMINAHEKRAGLLHVKSRPGDQ